MKAIVRVRRLAALGLYGLLGWGVVSAWGQGAPGTKLWEYSVKARMGSSPSLGPDGTIYFGAGNALTALHGDTFVGRTWVEVPVERRVKWSFAAQGAVLSTPAVDQRGTVYFGSLDRQVYAVSSTGTQVWAFATGGAVYSSPTVDDTGTVYVGSDDGKLYALEPDGKLKWAYSTGGYVRSSPSLGAGGVLYVGSFDNCLHAVTTAGERKWSFETGHYVYSSPAIAADGTIYFGSVDKTLYALRPDGTKKWGYATGGHIYASPAIGADGSIYIGSWDNRLYALTPEGTLKWSFATGNLVQSSPAIGSDGTVYFGSDENKIYAVSSAGAKLWAFVTGSLVRTSPVLARHGTLYCGSEDNRLYAIKAVGAPSVSPWPMFRAHSERRGRVLLLITNEPQSQTVTVGQPISFSVGVSGPGPLRYQWRVNSTNFPGAQTNTMVLSNAQPHHAGLWVAVVSNSLETVTSASAKLTVVVPPVITQQPESQTNVVGQNATFRLVAASEGPLSYEWSFQGKAMPGETNPALTVQNLSLAQVGDYAVVVKNAAGVLTSAVARLAVVAPPEITDQPQNQVGAIGSTLSFAVGARSTAPLTYQWRLNGTNLPGANGPLLEIKNVQPAHKGSYSVVVGNRAGTVASAAGLLTVTLRPDITTQPNSQTGVVNRPLTLGVVANSAGPLAYQWYRGENLLTGAVANTLNFPKPQPSNEGAYRVVVSNVAGVVTSSAARLTFLVPPALTLQPQSQTGAFGKTVVFRAAATGTPPLYYTWRWEETNTPAAPEINGRELRLSALIPSQSGPYSVVVSNQAGAITSAPALLTVPRPKSLWERMKSAF